MYILSEMYFSFYFIILDQYLLIWFLNINIFYLLKRAFNKSNFTNCFMSGVFYFIGLIFYSFYGFGSTT